MRNRNNSLDYLHAQQASAWLETLRNAGPEQRAAFVAWLKESPRNVREILLMVAIDQTLERLDAQHLHDVKSLLAQVDQQLIRFPASSIAVDRPAQRARTWQWLGAAASVLAISVAGWFLLASRTSDWKEFQTARSEQRAFELDDGSVIQLNTHSHVAVRFTKQARHVRLLEGEVLFRVHHDPARPFSVNTSDAVIQDIGTQFNVYSRTNGTVISVIEGSVNVTPEVHFVAATNTPHVGMKLHDETTAPAASMSRTLNANEQAEISHAGLVTVRAIDASDAVAWQQRRLVFRQQTLGHIVEEFNRYGQQKILLQGPAITNRIYTGVFDADDPDSLAQVLARDADLMVEKSDQAIIVRSR